MRAFDVRGNAARQGRASSCPDRRLTAIKHMKAIAEISDGEAELVLQGVGEVATAAAGTELLRPGALLSQPRVLLSGWAGLSVVLPDGRRQFLDFALPGDLVGCSMHVNGRAKAAVICLTPVEAMKIPALARCLATPDLFPGLIQVLSTAQDRFEDRLLNQIVRNGCQTAQEKMCSLLLELYTRLALAGLAQQHSFELPISQIAIADAVGLSTVHVNRTLQHLKHERIIQVENHHVTILNFPVLRRTAGQVRLPRSSEEIDLS